MNVEDPQAVWSRGRLAGFATDRLRDMIVAGELLPGHRVSERIMTEQLGVSRTPLREAFKILQGEGLVRIEPNRGATVVDLSVDEVDAAIETIVGLESVTAELSCRRARADQIDEIAALQDGLVTSFRDGALMDYFRINQTIHQKIVDCAGNPNLSRIYAAECARVRRYRFAGNQQAERWRAAVGEHQAIFDALEQREGALLKELLRVHHQRGWAISRSLLEDELRG